MKFYYIYDDRMHWCKDCAVLKAEEQQAKDIGIKFEIKTEELKGINTAYICKECAKKINKKWKKERFKKGYVCGEKDRPCSTDGCPVIDEISEEAEE